MQEHVEQLLRENPDYWCPQQFNNQMNPFMHEGTTGPEIWRQVGEIFLTDQIFLALPRRPAPRSGGRWVKYSLPIKYSLLSLDDRPRDLAAGG